MLFGFQCPIEMEAQNCFIGDGPTEKCPGFAKIGLDKVGTLRYNPITDTVSENNESKNKQEE